MRDRPIVCLIVAQAVVLSLGAFIFEERFGEVPFVKHDLRSLHYEAARLLPLNHLIQDGDLKEPNDLPRSLLRYLPNKSDFTGHYLRQETKKGATIQKTDVADFPLLKPGNNEALYFLGMKDETVPLGLLDAGVAMDLSYCFKESPTHKECKPTIKPVVVAAISCSTSGTKSCTVALKVDTSTEAELGRVTPGDSMRIFLRTIPR